MDGVDSEEDDPRPSLGNTPLQEVCAFFAVDNFSVNAVQRHFGVVERAYADECFFFWPAMLSSWC